MERPGPGALRARGRRARLGQRRVRGDPDGGRLLSAGGADPGAPDPGARAERIAAVLDLLRAGGAPEPPGPGRELRQLAGGWSRHTYLLSAPGGGPAYIVRVKPPGSLLSTDLVREYRTYLALEGVEIPTPRAFGVHPDEESPFGGPFFVMEWRPGEAPNVWQRRSRAALEQDWAGGRGVAGDFVTTLARLHAADPGPFAFLGPPRSFADVVERWRSTYERMRLVADPIVDEAFAWLGGRAPDDVPATLVHGDYRIGNMLVDGGRVTALVDWELAYLGDPRFDLGYLSLDYLAGKFVRPGSALACATAERGWLYAEYERRAARRLDPEVIRTYSAVGALMLITILCTGARMYADGRTSDVRMAWNRFAIPGLRQDLTRLMEW